MDKSNQGMILVTASGPDQPGVIAAFTAEVAASGARIRDIEQTVTHNLLSLSLLLDMREAQVDRQPLLKELLFLAKEWGLELDFDVVNEADYLQRQPQPGYVLTVLGDRIKAPALAAVSRILAREGVNIQRMNKLTQGELRCVEMLLTVPAGVDVPALTRHLLQISAPQGVDIALQRESLYRRAKRLVVLDMDSTLIQIEVIDELAHLAGVGDQVAAVTQRAMNGELDFEASLRERVSLLAGLSIDTLEQVYQNLPFTPGAKNLLRVLSRLGFKTAVISGGFSYFTQRLQQELGLDYVFANQLHVQDGCLTGEVEGQVVDGQRKAQLLEEIAGQEGVTLDQVIAIGDGANDLPMLDRAGLGIAFNAKARVREQADTHINQKGLDSILYLLGLAEWEVAEATR